jgi:predicted O-methyltransferase YrrM
MFRGGQRCWDSQWKIKYEGRMEENKMTRIEYLKFLPKNKTIAEIGTFRGEFADDIIKYAIPKKLVLIDCWDVQNKNHIKNNSELVNVNLIKMKRIYLNVIKKYRNNKNIEIIKSYSKDAFSNLKNKNVIFDWVYIDANHTYQNVYQDLSLYSQLIKNNGFISGHDFNNILDVKNAVDRFCEEFSYKIFYVSDEKIQSYYLKRAS